MAWTAPFTAVATEPMSAAEFNASVRDNLLQTAPAKAVSHSQWFVSDGPNSIAARAPQRHAMPYSATGATRTSTSYGDLSDGVGPTVTVDTGQYAWVIMSVQGRNDTSARQALASYAVTGDTTISPDDTRAWLWEFDGSPTSTYSYMHMATLNPGTNTFTMKYRVVSGTIRAYRRELIVIPF